MIIFETTNNPKLGIDNRTAEMVDISNKLLEESSELSNELDKLQYMLGYDTLENRYKAIGELLDIIQVLVLAYNKLTAKMDEKDIKACIDEHNFKLFVERGWNKGQAIEITKKVEKHNTLVGMIKQSLGDRR